MKINDKARCTCGEPNTDIRTCPRHGWLYSHSTRPDEASAGADPGAPAENADSAESTSGFSVSLTCDACGVRWRPGAFHSLECTSFKASATGQAVPMPPVEQMRAMLPEAGKSLEDFRRSARALLDICELEPAMGRKLARELAHAIRDLAQAESERAISFTTRYTTQEAWNTAMTLAHNVCRREAERIDTIPGKGAKKTVATLLELSQIMLDFAQPTVEALRDMMADATGRVDELQVDWSTAHPRELYNEETQGSVLWWHIPVEEGDENGTADGAEDEAELEEPYVGCPSDEEWAALNLERPFTHWTVIPIPEVQEDEDADHEIELESFNFEGADEDEAADDEDEDPEGDLARSS